LPGDDFNPERYLALAQSSNWAYRGQAYPYEDAAGGDNLSISNAVASMKNQISALGSGQAARMPDGIGVKRKAPGQGYETTLTQGGLGRKTHSTPQQAAQEMLDQSARNETHQSLGGRVHYKDAKSAISAMNAGKLDDSQYDPDAHSADEAQSRFTAHQTQRTITQARQAMVSGSDPEPAGYSQPDFDPLEYDYQRTLLSH
jgi:hypothetical protein